MSFDKLEEKEVDENNKNEEKKERYKSKDGFVYLPIIRGLYEIRFLLEDIDRYNGFICGGYARWCVSPNPNPTPSSDIDIYVNNEDNFNKLKNHFEGYLQIKHENVVSITYHKPKKGRYSHLLPLQLIKPFSKGRTVTEFENKDIKTVLENFDFTIARAAIVRLGINILHNEYQGLVDADFEHDENANLLRFKKIHCPIGNTFRAIKYSKKGYYIPPSEVLKLFLDWDERDENYKIELIESFRKMNEETMSQEDIDKLEALIRID